MPVDRVVRKMPTNFGRPRLPAGSTLARPSPEAPKTTPGNTHKSPRLLEAGPHVHVSACGRPPLPCPRLEARRWSCGLRSVLGDDLQPLARSWESIHLGVHTRTCGAPPLPVIEPLTVPGESWLVDVSTRRVADMLVCGGVDMRTRPHVEPSSCPRVDVRTPIGVSAP